ncbi:MAG TPA: RES family NAD+ phosphorylase [Steroidobacteraceae bacterium]|nr:RES family NAD+ phosphorylase [Steroidobacteraceae bacterium]
MVSDPSSITARPVRLAPCHRIVPSRLPTIHLFERIADPADWDALYQLESMTNPRLRNEVGDLNLVPVGDRVAGLNASVVMAPFTHIAPLGTRFTDGRFGAYYAAESLDTAIAETRFHRENFLRATGQPPIELEMRCYLADVACELHDIRNRRLELADVYDPMSYVASQVFGRTLRDAGANGIAFDSVRRPAGHCVAIFRPRLVQNVRQGIHLRYAWDGSSIAEVYEIRLMNL